MVLSFFLAPIRAPLARTIRLFASLWRRLRHSLLLVVSTRINSPPVPFSPCLSVPEVPAKSGQAELKSDGPQFLPGTDTCSARSHDSPVRESLAAASSFSPVGGIHSD